MPSSLPNLGPDLRHALRQLRRAPAFSLTSILILALGIGATTAVFSLVYQVLLRSIPVSHPEQLYKVGREVDCCVSTGLENDWSTFSFDLYRHLRDAIPGTGGIAAVQAGFNLVSVRRAGLSVAAQPLSARFVSGNYFAVLGVQPLQGRLLTPEDDRPEAPPVAVISDALWQGSFAADPHLVGSTVLLTGHPFTIVGITARGFFGERNTQDPAGLWLPLAEEPTFDLGRPLMRLSGAHWLDLLVRLPHPQQVPALDAALQHHLRQWLLANVDQFHGGLSTAAMASQTTELVPASSGINDLREQYERSLKLLLCAAGFVLLIACANLANLMLVRGMARRQEFAIRSAMGAPRGRLVRQMLVESLVLAAVGGAASIAVACAGTRGMLALVLGGVQGAPLAATPSWPVLAFALAATLLTGLLFGIAPALLASWTMPSEALRGANRSTRDTAAVPQKLLVIAQAAMSLALLSSAGLLLTSLRHLEHQSFHFEPQGRLLATITLDTAGYRYDQLAALYRRFDESFSRLPGVQEFAYATYGPMAFDNWNDVVYLPGIATDPNSEQSLASYTAVSPNYFAALGTQVVLGRPISTEDTAGSAKVAVVNQAFVRNFLKGKPALGERFGMAPDRTSDMEIVGVVEDTLYRHPDRPVSPMFFTAIAQTLPYTDPALLAKEHDRHLVGNLIVHYRGSSTVAAEALRQALHEINPDIPITHLATYTDQLRSNFTEQEMVVDLTSLFALIALALAAVGLYGVTAYAVARRTNEIGLRMALGSTRAGVLVLVLRSALVQTALGLALGVPLALAAARLLAHALYQTSAFQPLQLIAVSCLLLLTALLAALLPARRAASIDPNTALRAD